jgi:glutamine---fructose-6-phosphate transaminase (isomerizing)
MCGIVGYVGPRSARPLLLAGLEKLEYRGYDSAGISVLTNGHIDAVRAVGNLGALRSTLDREANGNAAAVQQPPDRGTGIGHTRWATHGKVTEENAHPHFDTTDRVHVVVNGIIENYVALKRRLIDMGAQFSSETDAEVIAHLIAYHLPAGGLLEAVRAAYAELQPRNLAKTVTVE